MRSSFQWSIAAVGLATFASLISSRADACTCATGVLVSPPPNADDVPLNAVVIYESPMAPSLFDETHNVEIDATAEPFLGRLWLVRPNQPLPAQSTIHVTPPQGPGAPFPRFVTGTTTRDTTPQYSGATSFSAEYFDVSQPPCRSSCWSGNGYQRMRFEYPAMPDASSLLLLEVRRQGDDAGTVSGTVPIYRQYPQQALPTRAETGGCTFGVPKFEAGEQVCARIIAYDVTGRRSDPSPEICSTVAACQPSFDMSCSVSDACGSVGEPPDAGDAGPSVPDVVDSGTNEPDAADSGNPNDPDATTPPGKDAASPPGAQPDAASTPPAGNPGEPPDSSGCSIAHSVSHRRGAVSAIFALCAAIALFRRRHSSRRTKEPRAAK